MRCDPLSFCRATGSFSFFPKRNFNLALLGFMHCIEDISEHISVHDPTLTLPYKIALSDNKIGDYASVVYCSLTVLDLILVSHNGPV